MRSTLLWLGSECFPVIVHFLIGLPFFALKHRPAWSQSAKRTSATVAEGADTTDSLTLVGPTVGDSAVR